MAFIDETTPNTVYPYKGVKYIKINKLDGNGEDRSYQLLNAQSVTLNFPESGDSQPGNYEIVNKVEYNTYFLFTIDNETLDTTYTSSNSSYVRYNYDINVFQLSASYNVIEKGTLSPTASVFIDPFDNTLYSISANLAGENQDAYFGFNQGVPALNRVYWQNTPSIPMKYTFTIAAKTNDNLNYRLHAALFKISANEGFTSYTNVAGNVPVPPVINEANIIGGSGQSITGGQTSGLQNIVSASYNRLLTNDFQAIQITGITDNIAGSSVGAAIKIDVEDGGTYTPSDVTLQTVQLQVEPYYKIGLSDANPASFAGPSEGIVSDLSLPPNTITTDVNNLDVYEFSDYNPTTGNISLVEKSRYVQQCIRDRSSILPSNLLQIQNNIAPPAFVQDYLYELQASVNARYDGAKNTSADFNENSKDGLGLPPAEFGSVYFLNCIGAGGQYPEVKDATAYLFNTLVDQNSNVYQTLDDSVPQYIDLKYAFDKGTEVDVNIAAAANEFVGYDGLSGVQTVLGFGELRTLLNTGTGSLPLDYVNAIDFEAGADNAGSTVDNYLFNGSSTYQNYVNIIQPNNGRVKFNDVTGTITDQGYTYSETTGVYTFDPTDGASQTNAVVTFESNLVIVNNGNTNLGGADDGVTLKVRFLKNGTGFGGTTNSVTIYNGTTEYVTITSPPLTFNDGDTVAVQITDVQGFGQWGGSGVNSLAVQGGGTFTSFQDPTPSATAEESTFINPVTAFGSTSYTAQPTSILCFSEGISQNIGLTQTLSSSQAGDGAFGYSQGIVVPFDPQPGDEIRFFFNEDYSFTITKVVKPGELDDDTLPGYNRLYVQINGEVESLGQKRNHFLIRRYDGQPTQITTNKEKLFANVGDGTTILSSIVPVDKSRALESNLSSIVRNLTNEGIL
jgi:hypothetical protein